MSRLTIDTGVEGNSATGDSLRVAFEKVNTNFAELYSELGGDSLDAISFNNNTISTDITNADLILTGNGTGGVVIGDFNFSGNKISTTSSNANIDLDPAGTGNLILKSGNFLPNTDNTQYLGSPEKRWHTLYVGPGSININGVSITESGGKISLGTSTSISGTLEVNEITSADSSAIQINDGVNISGNVHLQGNTITLGNITESSLDQSLTLVYGPFGLYDHSGDWCMAMSMSVSGYAGGGGQMIFEGNNSSGYALVPSNDNQYTLGRPEVAGPGSAAYWKNLYTYAINFPDETEQTTAARFTVTGDDSTSNPISAGQQLFILGGTNISTAVTSNTVTINGPDLSSYATTTYVDNKVSANNTLTIADDTSTTSSIDLDSTLQVIGSSNITTSISGSTLTITGPNLSSYLTNSTLTVVGDDSTGVTLNSGETIKITGAGSITTAVSGDTLTITGIGTGYLTFDDAAVRGTSDYQYTFNTDGYFTSSTSSESPNYFFVTYNSTNLNIAAGWTVVGANCDTTVSSTQYPVAGYPGVIKVTLTSPASGTSGFYPVVVSDPNRLKVQIQPNPGTSDKYTFATTGITFPDTTVQTTAWTGTLTVNDSGLTINGGTGTIYQGPSGVLQVGDKKGGVYHATSTSSNGLFTFGMNGSGIMSAAVEGSLFVGNNLPSNNGGVTTAYGGWLVVENGGKFGTDVDTLGNMSIGKGVFEKFQAKQDATGTVEHDCLNGHIFYHTSPDANWTANFTNLNIATSYATSICIVIAQGGTGYYPNAVQIGGVGQTINWQGNATPTPSTNRTDVVTFSIINNSGTYTVLGQLTGF